MVRRAVVNGLTVALLLVGGIRNACATVIPEIGKSDL